MRFINILLCLLFSSCHFQFGSDYSKNFVSVRQDGTVRVTISNHKNEKIYYECRYFGDRDYVCSMNWKMYEFGKDKMR